MNRLHTSTTQEPIGDAEVSSLFDMSRLEQILHPMILDEPIADAPAIFSCPPDILLTNDKEGHLQLDFFFITLLKYIEDADVKRTEIIAHCLNSFLFELSNTLEHMSLSRENHATILRALEYLCGYQSGICGLHFSEEQKREKGHIFKTMQALRHTFGPQLTEGQEEVCKSILQSTDLMLLRFSRFVRWGRDQNREIASQAAGLTIGEIMRVLPLRRIKNSQRDALFQQIIALVKKVPSHLSEEIFSIAHETLYSDDTFLAPDINHLVIKLKNLAKNTPSLQGIEEYVSCIEHATDIQNVCLKEYHNSFLKTITHQNDSTILYFEGLTRYLSLQNLAEMRNKENAFYFDLHIHDDCEKLTKATQQLAVCGLKYARVTSFDEKEALPDFIRLCLTRPGAWKHPILSTILNDIVLFSSQIGGIATELFEDLLKRGVQELIPEKTKDELSKDEASEEKPIDAITSRLLINLFRNQSSEYTKYSPISKSISRLMQHQDILLKNYPEVLIQLGDWFSWGCHIDKSEGFKEHGKEISNRLFTSPHILESQNKLANERNMGRISSLKYIFNNAGLCIDVAKDISQNPEKPLHTLLDLINQEILCGLFEPKVLAGDTEHRPYTVFYNDEAKILFEPRYNQTPGSDGMFQQAKKFIIYLFDITKQQEKHLEIK